MKINASSSTQVKPRIRFDNESVDQVNHLLSSLQLNTVCAEATCPNLGECYKNGTATFMILGSHCSRACRFCDILTGNMEEVNDKEPENLADACKTLGLRHVVVTSVARDDLEDGGAEQFARTIRAVKEKCPDTTIEVLIPDFLGNKESLDLVIEANPEIINHNIETVERLSPRIRHRATYERSLDVLKYIKKQAPHIYTKTGIMLGLGETEEEVAHAMDDSLAVGVDFFTIGQYLQPSPKHYKLEEYISLEQFGRYNKMGMKKGFKFVASGPQVRSSYKAHESLDAVGVNKHFDAENSLIAQIAQEKA
ncbi:lipoyl synthase [Facklamia miroungae]|uniref:Lipoyl synthase n=1 Tax=Facklamia miroungae TaxID=120956 RepID=A0A1G7RVT9_9LACT|nr:lipoyl synthase [Facklamia miroungae]NKZ29286.1 lipoyl synthase [Facklamia miroungae]SDG13900.1 lipoic acid synthetase [Facklamia miroungae]